MIAALKILILPTLFVLPWVVMKLTNGEKIIQETMTHQPLLLILILLPSIIVSIRWIFKVFRR
jgi:hypothetical protein